jgi:uncharacterized protein YkwD
VIAFLGRGEGSGKSNARHLAAGFEAPGFRRYGWPDANFMGFDMIRPFLALLALVLALSACTSTPQRLDSEGRPLPQVYKIRANDKEKIEFRTLDAVNALRQASGAQALQLNAQLNAAAATHSRDMSVQNPPWDFGSDGSSPIDRVQRAGYPGQILGEAISESYESEVETLGAWMEDESTRRIILDPRATDLGFAWYQEESGKIWWTMVIGGRSAAPAVTG